MEKEHGREREPVKLSEVWSHIYGPQWGYMNLMSGKRIDGKLHYPQNLFVEYPRSAENAATWVKAQAQHQREVHHSAHLFTKPERSKEAAARLYSLYVDLDNGHLSDAAPKPTLVVETSPGRLQCYWRLDRSIPQYLAEDFNKRLAHTLGGDPSGWDLTQLLRIPGTKNYKYALAPVVRVLEQSQHQYQPWLFHELPALPEPPQPPVTIPRRGSIQPLQERRMPPHVEKMLSGERVARNDRGEVDRSGTLFAMGLVLFEAGYSQGEIVSMLLERDIALGYRKFADRGNPEKALSQLVEYIRRTGSHTRRA